MNSRLKRKCTKGSRNKHIKLYLTQNQETKITAKGPQRIDNIFGETWLLTKLIRIQKLKWHKHKVITTRKQQEILKNNLKQKGNNKNVKFLN